MKVASAQTCIGNTDLNNQERPPFADHCDVLISSPNTSSRCAACSRYRKTLQRQILRRKQSITKRVEQSSRVQHSNLTHTELLERSRNLSKKVHTAQVQCNRLRKQLDDIIKKDAVEVDIDTSQLCHSTVESALDHFESGSLKKLFLEQQIKANDLKNKASMRWHPSIIRLIHSREIVCCGILLTSMLTRENIWVD